MKNLFRRRHKDQPSIPSSRDADAPVNAAQPVPPPITATRQDGSLPVEDAQQHQDVSPPCSAHPPEQENSPELARDFPEPSERDAVAETPISCFDEQPIDLATQIEELSNKVVEMRSLFEEKIAYDSFKEKQIDRLHEELQLYKADILKTLTKPFIDGVIKMRYDVDRALRGLRDKPLESLTTEMCLRVVDEFATDLEVLLEEQGMSVYREASVGKPYDARRLQAIVRVETIDPALEGTVCESLAPGFQRGGVIFQKERVSVYRCRGSNQPRAVS